MEWDDVVDVLTVAASFDQRTLGDADVRAWSAAFAARNLNSRTDAIQAVAEHYAFSRERIMPFDVIERVHAIRAERLKGIHPTELVRDVDPDDPNYLTILRARTRAVGDGLPVAQVLAITSGANA